MKVRNGFVSNSSSSSFCIYGARTSQSDMTDYLKKDLIEMIKKNEKDWDNLSKEKQEELIEEWLRYDFNYTLEELTGFSVYSPYDSDIYIGREWDSIKDDETGKEFKESVEKSLKLYFDNIKCQALEETYYC